MSTTKSNKEGNKLTKYAKKSLKMLMKARDLYVRSMTDCSDKITFTTTMGCPTGHLNSLLGSHSVSSSKSSNGEDFRELLRVASTKARFENKIDLECQRRQSRSPGKSNNIPMHRSYSRGIGIGRIDEEEPCDLQDDFKAMP